MQSATLRCFGERISPKAGSRNNRVSTAAMESVATNHWTHSDRSAVLSDFGKLTAWQYAENRPFRGAGFLL
jgi:hypothetical protein